MNKPKAKFIKWPLWLYVLLGVPFFLSFSYLGQQQPPSEIPSAPPSKFFRIGHSAGVLSLSFSPDGRWLASGSADGIIKVWDVNNGQLVKELDAHTGWIGSLAFSPDGHLLASAGHNDGAVRLWEVETGLKVRELRVHRERVDVAIFSPDGLMLATGDNDGLVKLWNVDTGNLVRAIHGHPVLVLSLAFSPDGRWLASGGDGDYPVINLWEFPAFKGPRRLKHRELGVEDLCFSPDSLLLASAGNDGTIRLWNVSTGKASGVFQSHGPYNESVAFNKTGQLLASCNGNQVELWELPAGRLVSNINENEFYATVNCVRFSPDGRLLATAADDRTVRLWDPATGENIMTWASPLEWKITSWQRTTAVPKAASADQLNSGQKYLQIDVEATNLLNRPQELPYSAVLRRTHGNRLDGSDLIWEGKENLEKLCRDFRNEQISKPGSTAYVTFTQNIRDVASAQLTCFDGVWKVTVNPAITIRFFLVFIVPDDIPDDELELVYMGETKVLTHRLDRLKGDRSVFRLRDVF